MSYDTLDVKRCILGHGWQLDRGVVEHHDRPKDSILMGNRRAEWKVARRFVSMGSLLLLEPYVSGAYPQG